MPTARIVGVLVLALALVSPLAAQSTFTLAPSATGNVLDQPRDGIGDVVSTTSFAGLMREQSTRENRAIQEYDLSPILGQGIVSATISGTVNVNNAFNNGLRTFQFIVMQGDGVISTTDFEQAETDPASPLFNPNAFVVGTGSYDPPNTSSFNFSFDVTAQLGVILNGGATWLQFVGDCTSDPNFPNILSASTTLTIVTSGGGTPGVATDLGGAGTIPSGPLANMNIPTPPTIGNALVLDVSGQPNASGELYLNFGPTTPIPFGGTLVIHIDFATAFLWTPFTTDPNGDWQYNLPLPNDPTFVGLANTWQAVVFGGAGVQVTNGYFTVVGG